MIVRRTNQQQQQQQFGAALDGFFQRGPPTHLVDAAMQGNMFRGGDGSETRKRRCVVLGVVVVVGIMVVYLEVFREKTKVKIVTPVAHNDPSIVNSSRRPNPHYLTKAECQHFAPADFATDSGKVPWKPIGDELQRPIKESDMANPNTTAWTEQFGYGTAVAMSGDGHRIVVAYEGTAGIDKAFGAHIDVYQFENTVHHTYELQQTLSDVTRFHGRDDHRVLFESVAMSRNGNRLAFSDGHGIHVYEFDEHYYQKNKNNQHNAEPQPHGQMAGPWVKINPEINLKLKDSTPEERKKNVAGTQIAMNCDGTVIAVSGKRQKGGGIDVTFAHMFQLEIRNDIQRVGYDWADLGEIDSIKHGGSIALDASGRRLAVGSVAYDYWKGGVQVYDYNDAINQWHPVGATILGDKELEQSGGQVALNADGTILAVADKDGVYGRVATYRLVSNANGTGDVSWEPFGEYLRGSGNAHEHFGADISLSDDGQVLAVGAPGDRMLFTDLVRGNPVLSENRQYLRGRIYMYHLSATGQWIRVDDGELQVQVDGIDGDMFGKSVALSSNGVWVLGGAPRRHSNKSIKHIHGTARVFRAALWSP